jgi:hypothetical protein
VEALEEHDASIRPALIKAQTYLAYEKQIRNLHLQEARLVRRREKETTELRRLQQDRTAKESGAGFSLSKAGSARPNPRKHDNSASPVAAGPSETEIGFDFSTGERQPLTGPQSAEILLADAKRSTIPAAA